YERTADIRSMLSTVTSICSATIEMNTESTGQDRRRPHWRTRSSRANDAHLAPALALVLASIGRPERVGIDGRFPGRVASGARCVVVSTRTAQVRARACEARPTVAARARIPRQPGPVIGPADPSKRRDVGRSSQIGRARASSGTQAGAGDDGLTPAPRR